jgi:hypothetical protein
MPVHPPRAADLVDVLAQRSYQAFEHARIRRALSTTLAVP